MNAIQLRCELLVALEFRTTEEGGRDGPTPPDRLKCIVAVKDRNFDCMLDLAESGKVFPGDSVRVPLKLLDPESALPYLEVGTDFFLRDYRCIARGKVVSALE